MLHNAEYVPYCDGMLTFDTALIEIGRCYTDAVAAKGGRSLSRVATIVANTGTFFSRLETGATCTTRSLEKFAEFFGDPANWPGNVVPDEAATALQSMGRSVKVAA